MSQAVVDPGEVRVFAHQLKAVHRRVAHQMAVVQRQIAGLGTTWRDQEHKKFMEDFEQQNSSPAAVRRIDQSIHPVLDPQSRAGGRVFATEMNSDND